jgi:hypothetical protein
MNGLSIRMILFIVVLSALHISGIPPVQTRDSLSPHPVVAPFHANQAERIEPEPGSRLGTKAPQEITQLRGDLRRAI